MEKIGLLEAIATLRSELSNAVATAQDENIQFPVDKIELEFKIGATRDLHGNGKLKFWVLELGVDGGYKAESVQRVTLILGAPVNLEGKPVKIRRRFQEKP
jgi:Trypsin-co-occurring domain 2